MSHTLYIISGCNGAGKTTASFTILPEILNCYEFVNADEIARGLSPFRPESVAIEAGRIMLQRIDELLSEKVDFALETTLSSKIYKHKILRAQALGYKIVLLFFWLRDVALAIERVKIRVSKGGHDIPVEAIKRRYKSGIVNLFNIYMSLCDKVIITDNSQPHIELIAEGSRDAGMNILDYEKWQKIKHLGNEKAE